MTELRLKHLKLFKIVTLTAKEINVSWDTTSYPIIL